MPLHDAAHADSRPRLGSAAAAEPSVDLADPRFEVLDRLAIQPLAARVQRGDVPRVWIPDCGQGVHAYAIAMALAAAAERAGGRGLPRIFATDRDPKLVRAASAGRLGRETARSFLRMGHRRRLAWRGDGWQVRPEIRGRILFSVHDPLHEPSFANIDLIVAPSAFGHVPSGCTDCLLGHLIQALCPDGLLYLGADRFIDLPIAGLLCIDRSLGLYRRTPFRRRASDRTPALVPRHGASLLQRLVHHFVPAALVVDARGRILARVGNVSRLLEQDDVPADPSLATAGAAALRPALVGALVEAVRLGAPGLRLADPEADLWIEACAIAACGADDDPLWLVHPVARRAGALPGGIDAPTLRSHLESTARTLRDATEDLETRNLALATANDELQAINDELEGSNRRLAALNTEMQAVRQENERQIDELSGLTNDIDNLLRSADIAVVVLDAAHRIRRFTPAAGRLFGLGPRDRGATFGPFLGDHDRLVMGAVAAVALDGGEARLRVEGLGTDPTSAFLVQVHPYIKDEAVVSGTVIAFVDMTEIKVVQDSLERQNLQLHRANEDLERFAYIASHDLKSPLRSVRTMLEFLRTDLKEVLQADHAEHLDLVAARVGQMERMIEDLLAYSRLGRQPGNVARIEVGQLVAAQLDFLQPPEGFAFVVEDELGSLVTEPSLLEHVLRNLLDNAVKHHDRPDGRIVVRCQSIEGVPTFTVTDDGPGIAERYQQRVLEIFQKGGGRADTGGSGMGLALVKKAVESQGGTLQLESRDGERGTTFRFTWPEQAQPAVIGEPAG